MIRQRREAAGTWLLGGAAGLCLGAIVALLAVLCVRGSTPFWPARIGEFHLRDGSVLLGETIASDRDAVAIRGSENARIGGAYRRIARTDIDSRSEPPDAFALTLTDGRRLFGRGSAGGAQLGALLAGAGPTAAVLDIAHPNASGTFARVLAFTRNLGRFLTSAPVASDLAGGALPALAGTLTLVLLMSVMVMPFGVVTAAYLHRHRGRGVRWVRRAINTMAGVPSIVYGVLGLGLFVHGFGGNIDRLFNADRLPVPTFGSGGLLWAALTLGLLTLPVVVTSIEEGLARIPAILAEGSLALGATREETLWHLLLPAARPALLTGLVLAIARAAGAVAPLMLVGVVKLAPAPPVDGAFPYLHPSRQFMHLGFEIYDAALASPDAIRGVPRAYACAALLVGIVIVLNLSAILLRNRLRDRYRALET
jgi:phosphate transport system permease protein